MKKILAAAALLLLTQTAFAFSPLSQSINEIRDIISSPQLRRFFPPQEAIIDIRWIRNGYLISTTHYQLFVEVIYGPSGAREAEIKPFTLKFGEPESK